MTTKADELLALARKAQPDTARHLSYSEEHAEFRVILKTKAEFLDAVREHLPAMIKDHNAAVERLTRERDEARDDCADITANADYYAERALKAESALAAAQKRCGELIDALKDAEKRLRGAGMIGRIDNDPVLAALAGKDAPLSDDQWG